MSKTYHHGKRGEREVRVRTIKRDKPDLRRLARALISLAEAELEKEAQAEYLNKPKKKRGRT